MLQIKNKRCVQFVKQRTQASKYNTDLFLHGAANVLKWVIMCFGSVFFSLVKMSHQRYFILKKQHAQIEHKWDSEYHDIDGNFCSSWISVRDNFGWQQKMSTTHLMGRICVHQYDIFLSCRIEFDNENLKYRW